MIKIENNIGKICITDEVFTNLAGEAATSCFGVKGMVACAKEGGPWQLLRRESMSKGVRVHNEDDGAVSLELLEYLQIVGNVDFAIVIEYPDFHFSSLTVVHLTSRPLGYTSIPRALMSR